MADAFHATVAAMPRVFEAAARDMGRSVDATVVQAVWERLIPGALVLACSSGLHLVLFPSFLAGCV